MASPMMQQPSMPDSGAYGHGPVRQSASHSPAFPLPSQPAAAPKQTPVPIPVPGAAAANGVKPPVVAVVTSDIQQETQSASAQHTSNVDKDKRFHDDYARLSAAIQESDPDAMNVTMHQADMGIFQRAVRDYGARFLEAGKHELINAMTTADIDEVADKILAKASDTFLDRALHVKKKICVKTSPLSRSTSEAYMCPHCAQRFGGMAGLQYHMMNKVCGDFGEVIKDDIASIPKASLPPPVFNPPVKRPAPDSAPMYVASGSNSPAYSNTQTPRAPSSSQAVDLSNAPLGTPQHKDMAHLTVHQIEALKAELQLAEEGFKMKIDAAQKAGGDPDELQKKLAGFRNSYACKQSTIRKKYGIKLRQRRNREEMELERQRMGMPDGVPRTIPTPSKEGHADKRVRLNGNGDASATQTPRDLTPIQTVAVTDMANGLNGSNATAATQDPTASMSMSQPPTSAQPVASRPPPSTYHQGNYRVGVHVPSPSKKVGSAPPDESAMETTPSKPSSNGGMTALQLLKQVGGDAGAPIDLDDVESSSESDSSSDEED
ncbi:hypothetical protein CNYM01_13278 [Colletotrichum nymphaeae SA-01]|uniref:Uncharacterized protein n=1 Tax=Colletotrichum nymphaeae SA-01 TaxID=1460502 RepID=A0A135S0R3_9PEZI|nr:hypothetical protein CNYM01_13278 [Colletotrichum nymphaeae SA-01]